ncbi:MAG: alkaline phosphatase family protein [Armatimonadota bacterium]|nr:alkaline phosphatase family protein [Armatimonadota bacterium]
MVRRILAGLAVAVVLVAVGYGSQRLAESSWNAVVHYKSPYARPLVEGEAGRPLAHRLVLVVIDGLREDASRRMPNLNALRDLGADFVAWAGEPSLSLPGWTVIISGAPQEVSGVTTNWYKGPVQVDSIFAAAKRVGMRTALAGTPGWRELFGPWIDDRRIVPDPKYGDVEGLYRTDAVIADAAIDLLKTPARLIVVHFPGPDVAGHSFGAVSPVYAEAIRRVDEYIGQIHQAAGQGTVLIVTADHGHIDRGGHGGWEPEVRRTPLVLAGEGIRPGLKGPEVRQMDIAPTISILLGLPIPAHNNGRPLVEALEGDLQPAVKRWVDQQKAIVDFSIRQLGRSVPPVANMEVLTGDVLSAQKALWTSLTQVKREKLNSERFRRLPLAAGSILPVLLYAVWSAKRGSLAMALGGMVAYFLVALALFFGRGFHWSLSVFNTEEQILQFFTARMIDAVIALAVGVLLAGALSARRTPGEAAFAGLDTAALVAGALVLQVAYFYWLWDVKFPWYLPDLRLGFKYYLDLLQLTPVGLLSPLAPLLGLAGFGAARLLRRVEKLPS